MKKYFYLQCIILFSGVIFSWSNVLKEFSAYLNAGGKIFQFVGCPQINPITTACFWGATAFLIAFIWSIYIINAKQNIQRKNENKLKWFLVASTIFGWGNVALEFYKFYSAKMQPIVSCTGVVEHPIYAPCFLGSIIFLVSLLTSINVNNFIKVKTTTT